MRLRTEPVADRHACRDGAWMRVLFLYGHAHFCAAAKCRLITSMIFLLLKLKLGYIPEGAAASELARIAHPDTVRTSLRSTAWGEA